MPFFCVVRFIWHNTARIAWLLAERKRYRISGHPYRLIVNWDRIRPKQSIASGHLVVQIPDLLVPAK